MDNTFSWYVEDLKDYISALHEALFKIEGDMQNEELINDIFRTAHSIKGNSATVRFFKIKEVVHSMEDILHDIREGALEMTNEIIQVLYACYGFLEDSLQRITKDKSDINLETKPILALLDGVKSDDCFGLSTDLIELIEENVKRGYELYHIKVDISKQSTKRSQINNKIIKKMRLHGHVIGTMPKHIISLDLVDAPVVKNTHSEFLLLSEDDQSNLLILLKDEIDVVRYECIKLSEEQRSILFQKSNQKTMIKTALRHIDEIKIEALDIKNEYVNNDAVEKIRYNFNQVSLMINQSDSYYAKMIITKTCEILNQMEINKVCFDANDMQAFVFICSKLSELVQDPSLEVNKDFVNDIEDKIMCLVERCGKQKRRIGDILVEEGIMSNEDVQDILDMQKNEYRNMKFGQVAVLGKKASADVIINTLLKQNMDSESHVADSDGPDLIRISAHKIEDLVKMLDNLQAYNNDLEQQ